MDRIESVKQLIARSVSCLNEESKFSRKRAIENIKKETLDIIPPLQSHEMRAILGVLLHPTLKLFSDPVEICRELSVKYLMQCFEGANDITDALPYTFPVLIQRLGQPSLTEPSEEVRLLLIEFIGVIIKLSNKNIAPYLDDLITIFKKAIIDPYPEVKKLSCKCAAQLARTIPETFHTQSESLIKPLLESISHQHSKVRVEVIFAIGKINPTSMLNIIMLKTIFVIDVKLKSLNS